MRYAIFTLLATLPAFGAEPPRIVAYPAAVVPAPLPSDKTPLSVGKFRWLTLENYAGSVTWDWSGDVASVGTRVAKPGAEFIGVKEGTEGVESHTAPDSKSEVLAVWGKTGGDVTVSAWGVVDNRAVKLATIMLSVQGARPPPVVILPPPIDTPPAKGLYYLIVRPNGPVQNDVLQSLKLPAWEEIRKAGHTFKDLPLNEVKTTNGKSPIPDGTPLPCVLALKIEGDTSYVIPPPSKLPATDADVRKLLEVKP
jgi:hypothetical protein